MEAEESGEVIGDLFIGEVIFFFEILNLLMLLT